jgi:hypothetical protein
MRIGRKLFPYPVLNNNPSLNAYEKTTFSLNVNVIQENKDFVLKQASINTNNETILEMIEDGLFGATIIVECSSTVYRSEFEISNKPEDIRIPIFLLRDKVTISSFIYSKKPIKDFYSNDFHNDYKPYRFNLEQYTIVAADDGITINVDYEEEESKKTSSIFLIINNEEIDNGVMKVDVTSKKIIINLSKFNFDTYHGLKNNIVYKDVFFSLIAVPALIYALGKIKESEETDLDQIRNDYLWFNSIEKAYERLYKTTLTQDKYRELSSLEFAQEVLDNPTTKSMQDLMNLNILSFSSEEE